MNESALNAVLKRIKAKDGQSQADPDLPKPESDNNTHDQKPGLNLIQGSLVEWRSPLFRHCQGKVAMVEGGQVLIDPHPVTGEPTLIYLDWVVRKGEE